MADDRPWSRTIAAAWAAIEEGRFEEAHELVQSASSPEAAYLHGVIHREEGDLGNARHWFGRAAEISARFGFDPMTVDRETERAALRREFEAN